MAKAKPTEQRSEAGDFSAPAADVPVGTVPAPDADRQALLDEINALRAKLERAEAAGGKFTPAPAFAGHAGPLRKWMVSLDHVHKGLITPSPFFAQQAAEIVPGKAARAIREQGEEDAAHAQTERQRELIRTRAAAAADAAAAAERAMLQRGRPIEAASEADAKAIFCELHGIVGCSGQGPEAREMTAEELERGEWGPPPEPGAKANRTRVPERPKRKQPEGPTAARDAALQDALTF